MFCSIPPGLRSRCLLSVCALFVCLWLTGCGGSNVVSVSGTLTYKGKPVTNAIVHFVPQTGRPSMGETDANGQFTLTYDPQTKGAEIGTHKVFVMHNAAADANAPGSIPGVTPKMSPEMGAFFSKYSGAKSTVNVTVNKSTSDLKLDWD